MNSTDALTLPERIAMILDGLCRAVAARIAPGIAGWAMQASMIVLAWTRIRRADGRIRALLARFLAGKLRVAPAGRVAVRRVHSRGASGPRGQYVPRRFAWLVPMVPYQAAGYASQLRVQLADPAMVALLEASPQACRILAPLCRMLGIEKSLLGPWAQAPRDVDVGLGTVLLAGAGVQAAGDQIFGDDAPPDLFAAGRRVPLHRIRWDGD